MGLDKFTKYAIAIIIIGSVLRFALAANNFPAGDSTFHLNVARFIADEGRIPAFENLGRNTISYPPVFYIVSALLYKIFGIFGSSAADIGIKLASPIFGSLTLWLSFLIARHLYNTRIAFYSTIFMSFLPMNIFLSSIAHLDITFAFFMILSVYLMLKDRWIWGAIVLGLANNVRFYGFILVPLLFYLAYVNGKYRGILDKGFITRVFLIALITGSLSVPWLARNYIEFNNPIYPGFDNILNPDREVAANLVEPSIANILREKYLTSIYLELFGVPNGNWKNLFFVDIPMIWTLIALWVVGTLLFLSPIALYKKSADSKKNWMMLIWPGILIAFMLLIAIDLDAQTRHFLPAIPVLAIIWGVGFDKMLNRLDNYKTWIMFLLVGAIVCFSVIEIGKNVTATNLWERYSDDFAWARENTPADSLFYFRGQGLSYHIHRPTTGLIDQVAKAKGYVWVQEETDASGVNSMLTEPLPDLKEYETMIAYENLQNRVTIYKIN